ncbi:imidazole glycerol phosphate synthase subunit HisH [Calidifontibacter sp. DB0510]|uniref:Imidazole glycerol phosphate synthase subunit HisH n=1 Tax=Metallococcus carri TaxID=1656884 RepID=A0A967B4W9_9MICO|nr:imidazole glycerol phosphate synthase subunit HisH [Metallococcus carri]NHN57410.1 imidazole glycerol phosphate synthase subunit HisH [Metallococcus carri]NOP39194.1 imidazole glycerol phosphate synthase subunit HisH [Calidifontibacter sp. DB2511S]
MKRVVVLDYGSGNVRSVVRMLERVGAEVTLTGDASAALAADGLYVPGVGNFHACVGALVDSGGAAVVRSRVEAGRPVLGVCVGFQSFFEDSTEEGGGRPGLGLWTGQVSRLRAPVVPHMGWSPVTVAAGSTLFRGVEDERFYFVHSFAPHSFDAPALVSTAEHGERFVAAVEDGALAGTQFHPEKSGDAGAHLLTNWLETL